MAKEEISIPKLEEAVKHLSEVDPSYEDTFELFAILVDDIADMYKASSSREFTKQKSDARRTLKLFKRKFENMTFKSLKMNASLRK